MDNLLIPLPATQTALTVAGRIVNKHAESAVFGDYHSRRSDNTIRTHAAGLALFAEFLAVAVARRSGPDGAGVEGVTGAALQNAGVKLSDLGE